MSRGLFHVRLESREWALMDELTGPAPFDAAIISDRYLAPWPEGHRDAGEQPDRLARAVLDVGRPYAVDPDTARLEHARTAERHSSRDAGRAVALAVGLPITTQTLTSPASVRALVDAAAGSQVNAAAFTAPYLEVSGPEDARLAANVRLLCASRSEADGRQVIGYLQFLRWPLVTGLALAAGLQMAQHADTIVIRARALPTHDVSAEQADALVDLVARLASEARVIVDCAGVAGPPLVAAGADAFSAGTRFFQSVAAELHPVPGGGGGTPLAPHATLASGGSASPPAPVGDDAVKDNARLRLWNLGQMRDAARLAARQGPAYAAVVAARGGAQGQLWAAALRQLARRTA